MNQLIALKLLIVASLIANKLLIQLAKIHWFKIPIEFVDLLMTVPLNATVVK